MADGCLTSLLKMKTLRTTAKALALSLVLTSACAALAQNKKSAVATSGIKARAAAVHQSSIVIDTHADTPGRFVDENFDIGSDAGRGHIDLAKIKKGNLGAEFFSIWVDPEKYKGQYAHRAFDMIDSVHEQVRRHPHDMVMAYSAEDIIRARTGPHKRLATLMGVEGGHAIENDIRILRDYFRLGARYMTLTWMNTNEWADASGDDKDPKVQHHGGLTPFGKDIVLEMNRLGMMVDVSHVSDKTFWDVINTTKAPVIASHSSARAVTNHYRNMDDSMLRAVAKNGGVVQVNFASFFDDQTFLTQYQLQQQAIKQSFQDLDARLKDATPEIRTREHERLEEEWAGRIPRPPLKSLIDHIDHIAKVAGVDHVGIGSDFDGITSAPEGIDSAADLPRITEALMARGYTAQDMRKILGGNLLRVFRNVERVSRQLQAQNVGKTTAAAR